MRTHRRPALDDLGEVNAAITRFLERATARANRWIAIANAWRDPANAPARILAADAERRAHAGQPPRWPTPEALATAADERARRITCEALEHAQAARERDTALRKYAAQHARHLATPTLITYPAPALTWPALHPPATAWRKAA